MYLRSIRIRAVVIEVFVILLGSLMQILHSYVIIYFTHVYFRF
jgi:hypothetical protein